MGGARVLEEILRRIDGRGYKAYKDLEGSYDLDGMVLYVDHVQGDPFAAPSQIRARVPMARAAIPEDLYATSVRRLALEDYLARRVREAIHHRGTRASGSGKSGLVGIDAGSQEVLARTAVKVTPTWVEARMTAGLPAAGRRVLGRQAHRLLTEDVAAAADALPWADLPQEEGRLFVDCVDNQEAIRGQLEEMGLVAFVADGSILPRASGASERPMAQATPFQAPENLRVELPLLHPIEWAGARVDRLSGMGITKGVTLIVGGGYHGKSTLLKALEHGVYPHVPGDGREYVVTDPTAVKIRAEDGRRVAAVDISPFISHLPHDRSTSSFSTDDASGSTSQAANIVEAVEVGSLVLLLDEDTSATNFMVRDARMQALVHKEHEPITPFVDRVRDLYEAHGISTVLVMGGSGDYFDVADTVVLMKSYVPSDATAEAKNVAATHETRRTAEIRGPMGPVTQRIPVRESFDASRGRRAVKIDVKGFDRVVFGTEALDLRGVEQLVDLSQVRAVGYAIYLARLESMSPETPLSQVLDAIEERLCSKGLDILDPYHRGERHPGDFARPRRFEIAAAINRLRTMQMRTLRAVTSRGANIHGRESRGPGG